MRPHISVVLIQFLHGLFQTHSLLITKEPVITKPFRTRPVSYTHLDVYKRQVQATRFTGGPDFVLVFVFKAIAVQRWFQGKKSDWSMSKDSR